MPAGSSPKRERQYEHIKDSAEKRGLPAEWATEMAARTVNKERARADESRTASQSSTHDISSGHRCGKRSHTGAQGRAKQQLYNEAKQRNIQGRSTMSKADLEKALGLGEVFQRYRPEELAVLFDYFDRAADALLTATREVRAHNARRSSLRS